MEIYLDNTAKVRTTAAMKECCLWGAVHSPTTANGNHFLLCQKLSLSPRERAGVRGNCASNCIVPAKGEGLLALRRLCVGG